MHFLITPNTQKYVVSETTSTIVPESPEPERADRISSVYKNMDQTQCEFVSADIIYNICSSKSHVAKENIELVRKLFWHKLTVKLVILIQKSGSGN